MSFICVLETKATSKSHCSSSRLINYGNVLRVIEYSLKSISMYWYILNHWIGLDHRPDDGLVTADCHHAAYVHQPRTVTKMFQTHGIYFRWIELSLLFHLFEFIVFCVVIMAILLDMIVLQASSALQLFPVS